MTRDTHIRVGPFTGVNNRAPDHALPKGKLRDALNVDLHQTGTLRRRDGYRQVVAGVQCHSAWSGNGGAYYVDGRDLKRVSEADGMVTDTVVFSGVLGSRVSYTDTPLGVVWSDGFQIRYVDKELTPAMPNPQPPVAVSSGGALQPGQYLMTFCTRRADGVVSPPTTPVPVVVPVDGEITVGPVITPDQVVVYLTRPDGQDFYEVGVAGNGAEVRLSTPPYYEGSALFIGAQPMPAGGVVRNDQGRLLVASGSVVMYSEVYAFGLYNPTQNFIPLPSEVTLVEPVNGGTYIATTEATWFHTGVWGSQEAALIRVAEFGAVKHSSTRDATTNQVWWFSDRGLVKGGAGGQLELVQDTDIAVNSGYVAGASILREADGVQHLVSSLFGGEQSVAAARSYIEAEVVTRGIQL